MRVAFHLFALCISLALAAHARAAGLVPEPTLADVKIQAQAIYDAATGFYRYEYAVHNPAANTGAIWYLKVDVSQQP